MKSWYTWKMTDAAGDCAKVIQVIETTLTRRGEGIEGDPIRIIRQYWSMDGELLAEVDPVSNATEEKQT